MAEKNLNKNFDRTLIEVGNELTMKNITDLISLAGFAPAQAEKIKGSINKAAALFTQLKSESLLSSEDVDTLIEDLDFLKLRKVKNILELYKSRNQLLVEKVIEEREKAKMPHSLPPEPIGLPVTPGKVTDRKHKIFISFSFKDEEKALGIKDRIEKHLGTGSCWICTSELRGGANMDEKISEAIDKATVLVCLVSRSYADSIECQKEGLLARQQKKKFIPVQLERVEWPLTKSKGEAHPMRMAFAQLIYIQLYKDEEGGGSEQFEKIIKALEEMCA